jgi:hypothetical protein
MEMKKERIVVICICAVLFGSLYAQGIAWTCHIAMPSTAQTFWPVPFDFQFVKAGHARSRIALPDSVEAFVCTGWPPLSFLYGEARLLKQEITGMRTRKDPVQENRLPEVLSRPQGMAIDSSAAALQKK